MLIETVELTLNHLGLGALNETALMMLFANAHAHSITQGRGINIGKIIDKNEETLYPAYYKTHLSVPPSKLLERHRLWDQISIGVNVRSFGGILLESHYVAGVPDEIKDDPATWDAESLVTMRGSTMFVVDHLDKEQQVSVPRANLLSAMDKLLAPPPAMDQFREVRARGLLSQHSDGNLRTQKPVSYSVISVRDAAAGHTRAYLSHTMVFARFIDIMDYAERELLTEQVWPPFPKALLDCRTVLEREVYYLGSVHPDQTVQITLSGSLEPCAANLHGPSTEIVSAGVLTLAMELYELESNALVAVSKVKKLLAVPSSQQSVLRDAERLLFQHARPNIA